MSRLRGFIAFMFRMAVLCAFGAVLAVAVNAVSPKGIAWLPDKPAEPTPEAGVGVEQAWEMVEAGAAFVIDARPKHQFAEAHVPGATNVPGTELPDGQEVLHAVLPGPDQMDDMKVLIYCEGKGCTDSLLVFQYLSDVGYQEHLRVLTEGFGAWQAAGLPIEQGEP
jgi:rhodanese-related sulfurtransferase